MFDSRSLVHKEPFGAVQTGTAVHFKITLPRDFHCSASVLILEKAGGEKYREELFWCGMNGGTAEWWECHFRPEEAGIYFYHFECRTNHGTRMLMRGEQSKAVLQGFDRWQLTVYEPFSTPDWLKGGLMYQIFPDRFARSAEREYPLPSGRRLHAGWQEPVSWQPAEDGEIYNDDFFGGNLKGIEEKLPYLRSLGVSCLYLNPIFESPSNHRYDTADYAKIDPLLGTEEDFFSLCEAADRNGIRLILDGVFSHTGSDSVYFNRNGRYDSPGAYQSQESPYAGWYHFRHWPDDYDCWWGFLTLPNVDETNPHYNETINGADGVVRNWLRLGASGWRLDVADELPDSFLEALHTAVKSEKSDALILGEVWEDASNKTAYGSLRPYLLGGQLDSVMNYPFRRAVLLYLLEGDSAGFFEIILSILENYPPQAVQVLMNHLGTHDTERILTLLGGLHTDGMNREQQSRQQLNDKQQALAVRRLKLASLIQYTLPGVPCLYYGDEAGMQGCRDPFNRGTFPWGRENPELLSWYRTLGEFRRSFPVLRTGGFTEVLCDGDVIAYRRESREESEQALLILINRGDRIAALPELLPGQKPAYSQLVLGADLGMNGTSPVEIGPLSFAVYACPAQSS